MVIWFTTSGSCAVLLGTLGASPLSSCGMMELNKWKLAYTYSVLTLYKLLAEGDENMNYIQFFLFMDLEEAECEWHFTKKGRYTGLMNPIPATWDGWRSGLEDPVGKCRRKV